MYMQRHPHQQVHVVYRARAMHPSSGVQRSVPQSRRPYHELCVLSPDSTPAVRCIVYCLIQMCLIRLQILRCLPTCLLYRCLLELLLLHLM